ncbi:fungal-specific transcription factor domain-containing protein [Dactylonectria macrodidyma]|uniref:Fungal-specific transcription factor domain-containing protein n=1 Tax=Dactylonectria macrodidyma TaxID=307937 RepID=A0A9P9E9D6_9HYPO|nr:fungal-specific transcription factor domain-containing protein [Dactylonectria macrodidyma]
MVLESSHRMDTPRTVEVARRSRAGCQQCRQRKRKCDERHPRCAACIDRDLQCNWQREEPRRQVSRRQHLYNKEFTVPQEMRPLVTVFTVPSACIQQTLLSHFRVNSPLWLTAGGHEKSAACLSVIMPVALRNPLVLNCVLALAAGDLSKYHPASSGLTSLAHGLYGQAVAGIHSALNKELSPSAAGVPSTHTGDDTLLAIILLCVNEAVNFTETDRIIPHINAAAILCYSRCFDTAPDARLRGLLFEIFCYIFTLTAFSHGHKLHLNLALQVFNSPFLSGSFYQGILLRWRCPEIFSSILRVTMLTSGTTSIYSIDEATASEIRILESQLANFPSTRYETDETTVTDEKTTSELYRLACLIHIKKILNPDLPDRSADIQGLVGQFITNLNILPPTSPANNILCWPLVVTGMSSVVMTHQRIIVGRLRKNHETWRSDILSKSAAFLSGKWREAKALEGKGAAVDSQDTRPYHIWGRKLTAGPQAFEFPVVML